MPTFLPWTCTVSATLLQQLNQIQQLQIQQLRKKTRFSNYRFSNYRFSNYPIQQLGQIQQLGFGNFATTDSATTQIQQLSSATKGPVLYYSYLWLAGWLAGWLASQPASQPAKRGFAAEVVPRALFGAHNCGSSVAVWSLHFSPPWRPGAWKWVWEHCLAHTMVGALWRIGPSTSAFGQNVGPTRHRAPTIVCAKQCSQAHVRAPGRQGRLKWRDQAPGRQGWLDGWLAA